MLSGKKFMELVPDSANWWALLLGVLNLRIVQPVLVGWLVGWLVS